MCANNMTLNLLFCSQHDNVPGNLDEACKPTPCKPSLCEPVSDDDVASMHNPSAVDAELLISSSRPAFCATRDEFDISPSPPSRLMPQSVSLSVTSSVFGAAGLKVTSRDSHIITLKIFNGNQIFRAVVYVKAGNRINILNEAKKYCMQRAQDDQSLKTVLAKNVILSYIH